jgi:serine/threonine protein kinase
MVINDDKESKIKKNSIYDKANKATRLKSFDKVIKNKAETKEKIIGGFKLGEKLGEGTFGKVCLGYHMITKEKVK